MAGARRAAARATQARPASFAAPVDEVAAAVLGPGRFVVPDRPGLLLAEAHRLDLLILGAREAHHLARVFRASLAERQVVLAAAALVAVALDREPCARVLAQIARVRLDRGPELGLDLVAVEVVVDRALRGAPLR